MRDFNHKRHSVTAFIKMSFIVYTETHSNVRISTDSQFHLEFLIIMRATATFQLVVSSTQPTDSNQIQCGNIQKKKVKREVVISGNYYDYISFLDYTT